MFSEPLSSRGFRARRPGLNRVRFFLESLESRRVLSTTTGLAGLLASPASGSVIGPFATSQPPSNLYSPSVIRKAYGFDQIQGDGSGQTIAIVDAYHDPNIVADLAAFDSAYGLPSAQLTRVDQNGGTSYPAADAGWSQEIALDVEWAHAIAPGAKILLVEANSASLGDLLTAAKFAGTKASVVSMSWGGSEFSTETSYDSAFSKAGVTFVASSGDSGGYNGPSWPSVSPNVVAVGGSTLSTTSTGAFTKETSWSGYYYAGSGGGVSQYEPLPTFQSSALGANLAAGRVTPDVAYNANPYAARGGTYGGFAVYDSYGVTAGWYAVGGTSAGAPQWAALVALADQARAENGLHALSSQETLSTLLYGLAGTENQSTPSAYFHDVTSGWNAYYSAGPGYDAVTGLGTPIANALVTYAAGLTSLPSPTVNPATATPAPTSSRTTTQNPTFIVLPIAATPSNVLLLAGSPYATVALPSFQALTATQVPSMASTSTSIQVMATPLLPVAQPLGLQTTIRELVSEKDEQTPYLGQDVQFSNEELPPVHVKESDAPKPAPAPAPVEEAKPLAPLTEESPMTFLPVDAGVAAYLDDLETPPTAEILAAAAPMEPVDGELGRPSSGHVAMLATGATIALWGIRESRSHRTENSRKRFFRSSW